MMYLRIIARKMCLWILYYKLYKYENIYIIYIRYVRVYMNVCMYICMYMYTCIHTHIHILHFNQESYSVHDIDGKIKSVFFCWHRFYIVYFWYIYCHPWTFSFLPLPCCLLSYFIIFFIKKFIIISISLLIKVIFFKFLLCTIEQ